MEQTYNQLSAEERVQIFHWHANGESARAIGVRLGRHHATISRELIRNSKATKAWPGGYEPVRANDLALRRRRWDCRFKMARQPELRDYVRQSLAMEHSPEQIAGRLALMGGSMQVSHESIYRFIAHRVRQKDYGWHVLLRRRKYDRGWRPKKGGPPSKTFQNYTSIEQRPDHINTRSQPGHWEADLMAFRRNTQVILVVHERKSRMCFAWQQPDKGADAVCSRLTQHFNSLSANLRLTVTYDNGTEFARHHLINQATAMTSYFCHTHSPWEKGGIENAIGRLRRNLPRKTNIRELSPDQIQIFVQRYNNTPRKCLGYLTPQEVWDNSQANSTVALQM